MSVLEIAVIISYTLIAVIIVTVVYIARQVDKKTTKEIKRDFERRMLKNQNSRQLMFLADSIAKNLFQDYRRVVITWEPKIHFNLLRGEVIALLHSKEPRLVESLSRAEYDQLVDNLTSTLHTMYYETRQHDGTGTV